MEDNLNLFILLLLSLNNFSVFSLYNHAGKLVFNAGPSCVASTHMLGMVQLMRGTCYPSLICRHKGGKGIGRCGISDVCCIFPQTCGGETTNNSTYFTNPGYPSSYNNSNTCLLTIHRTPGLNRICQLRIDFMDFELLEPINGECDTDFFTVNGQNLNSVVPKICGFNTGQHLYVDIDGVHGPINLNVQTYGYGWRRWNILISQIECNNPSKAPPNCLQYFMGPNGVIKSFNYDILLKTNSNELNSNSNPKIKEKGYFNSLDYSICFRKEQYYCTQTYSIETKLVDTVNDQSISISSDWTASGTAGSGINECPTEYLLLNGIRFCGDRLNSGAVKQNNIDYNEPITDEGTGPFIARFVSDKQWSEKSNRGFKMTFKQNPCLLQFPNSQPLSQSSIPKNTDSITKPELNPRTCKIFSSKVET